MRCRESRVCAKLLRVFWSTSMLASMVQWIGSQVVSFSRLSSIRTAVSFACDVFGNVISKYTCGALDVEASVCDFRFHS